MRRKNKKTMNWEQHGEKSQSRIKTLGGSLLVKLFYEHCRLIEGKKQKQNDSINFFRFINFSIHMKCFELQYRPKMFIKRGILSDFNTSYIRCERWWLKQSLRNKNRFFSLLLDFLFIFKLFTWRCSLSSFATSIFLVLLCCNSML